MCRFTECALLLPSEAPPETPMVPPPHDEDELVRPVPSQREKRIKLDFSSSSVSMQQCGDFGGQ